MSTSNKLFQAASGGAGESVYVEDVFSTFLYAGDSSAGLRTIDNGLNLLDEGGLIWTKERNNQASHFLIDTERGLSGGYLKSNDTDGANTSRVSESIDSFTTTGYKLDGGGTLWNRDNYNVVSWSFRKQAGAFDVVTYTGDGTSSRDIAHNLGSKPGFIITKRTNLAGNWTCYHQALGYEERIYLDLTNAKSTNSATWVQEPTATHFTVGSENTSGSTYVAYLFAHDDQSFGDNSDESIIKCGSYTGNGNVVGPLIDLGFEPQFIMIKAASRTGHWFMLDVMRGIITGSSDSSPGSNQYILANTDGAEGTTTSINVNSTGFQPRTTDDSVNENNATYIYMAIRRPMKTPEAGTEVFNGVLTSSDSSTTTGFPVDIGFPVDLAWVQYTTLAVGALWMQRLTGLTTNPQPGKGKLAPSGTTAEANSGELWGADNMTGYRIYGHTYQRICYGFKRATGFFDMVAYTGDGASSHAITHNLGVSPELIITKRRDATGDWRTATNFSASAYSLYKVNEVDPATNINYAAYGMYAAKPTSTTFTVGSGANVNASGGTFVSYLFGTVAGVSKVGSVVHSGTTDVDCGFSAGARFVMVKRADQNGDWYYWDTVRGIVAGNDDYLLLITTQHR